jgi:hydroxyacid-oxoacid transhydrogenase
MGCCHHYFARTAEGDSAFTIDASTLTFGPGCLKEAGDQARALGMTRIGLFTDARLRKLPLIGTVTRSLEAAYIDYAIYDEVKVEPTDASFRAASRFAAEGRFDGFISLGGGSVIDTCKAANLYSSHPADFLTYVNAPIGDGKPVPGPLKPHIACPTTSGTGSEATGIAIFDLLSLKAKTGIQSRRLKPTTGLIDPEVTRTLPSIIVASTGFDAMSHALETLTDVSYARRARPERASLRPVSQGANPFSDMVAFEAIDLIGRYLVRAVNDASDSEARTEMMYAATLAGIAFGNAGCHLPHGMSYAVSGLVRDYRASQYPQHEPFVPHGMSVVLNAPSVYRYTAPACPERHLDAARHLGADMRGAEPQDAGEVLAGHIIKFMQETQFPGGLNSIGFSERDLDALVEGAWPQQRVLKNAPREVTRESLRELFRGAMSYW